MVTTGQIIRFMTVRMTEGLIVTLLIMFMPNIPPFAKISDPIPITPTKPFAGKLTLNDKLNDVQIWHKGDVFGPESFADYNGELYTSLHTGEIVKLSGEQIIPVVKFGQPCKGFFEEKLCGRPLGIQFDKDGSLIAADAYYGIFRVDVKTGEKIQLVAPDVEIDGTVPKIPNCVAIASNGDIYWTDSSTEFVLEDALIDLFADGTGRLIRYNIATKTNTVLIDKLLFANGVALSDDEEFVIVAETGRSCIHRYYLKGPKKGVTDKFFDGLPGLPDNIKPDGQGGFLVALISARDDYTPIPSQILGSFPLFRRLVARIFGLTKLGFTLGNQIYPLEIFQRGMHLVGHFYTTTFVLPSRVTIIQIDKEGKVKDSFHGNNRKATGLSEAYVFEEFLYFGSPFNDYIARIHLNKLGLGYLMNKKPALTEEPIPTPTIKPSVLETAAPSGKAKEPPTKPPVTTTAAPKTTTSAPKVTRTEPPKPTTTAKPPTKASATKPSPKPTEPPKKAPEAAKPTQAKPKKETPSQNKV